LISISPVFFKFPIPHSSQVLPISSHISNQIQNSTFFTNVGGDMVPLIKPMKIPSEEEEEE